MEKFEILKYHEDFETRCSELSKVLNIKVLKYKNTVENPLNSLQNELNKYKVENNTHLPFIGGAVGYLSYDLKNYIEKLPKTSVDDTNVYDLYFGLYNWVIVVDHLQNKTYIATPNLDIEKENKIIVDIEKRIYKSERVLASQSWK